MSELDLIKDEGEGEGLRRELKVVELDPPTPELSRRDALSIMAIVPFAAALGTTPESIESAMRAAEEAIAQQQPAQAGQGLVQRPNPATYKLQFFTPHEYRTARMLADMIIPRDARSGSASDAGVPEFMDFMMIDRSNMQLQMRGGLRWMDNESLKRFNKRFIEATVAQREAILDDIAYPQRARPEFSHGVSFFNYFRDLTAGGFWSSRIGVRDIGYIGNQYVQWNGCPPEAMNRLGVRPDMMDSRIPVQRT